MLVLLNVKMKLSNVTKNKRTIECNKSTITYVVSIAKCEDGIMKCVGKKKRTAKYDKSTIRCYVDTFK